MLIRAEKIRISVHEVDAVVDAVAEAEE